MSDNALVVIFPSVFAYNKMNSLVFNIKKILQLQKQKFQKVKKDESVIIVEANDPVFASSAINLLFGIEKVAIAKQVKNDFNTLVSSIAKIGMNILLKGDRFYVKVEGHAKGFLPKDIEMAATSSLIEKTSKLDSKPGTEDKYDKLIYTYLTKSNGYVCIFTDKGKGGIPNNSQNEKIVCCIFDEFSAISCLETLREGFDVKIIVCFQKESDLLNLVKMVNRIIQHALKSKIELKFFKIANTGSSARSYFLLIETVVEILLDIASKEKFDRISLPVSPLIFPQSFIDKIITRISQKNLIYHIPLSGIDENILECAKGIGLEKHLPQIERLGKMKFDLDSKVTVNTRKIAQQALTTEKVVTITLGLNNVHDIIDSLKSDH
jgi:hypothetical protein